MNLVFISIILVAVIQVFVCHMSFALLFGLIGRFLFLLRLLGTVIPVKVSMIFEGCDLFIVFIVLIFSKHGVDWTNIGLTALFSAITILLYFIDNKFYLYVVEDDNNEEGE